MTDAIRIARSERSLEADRRHLEELKIELESPTSEYRKAEQDFKELDTRYETARKQFEEWEQTGDPRKESARKDLQFIRERWRQGRERFDLAIEERRAIQKKIGTLQEKIRRDRQALDKMVGDSGDAAPSEGASPLGPSSSKSGEFVSDPAGESSDMAAPAAPLSPVPNGTMSQAAPPPAAEQAPAAETPPAAPAPALVNPLTPGFPAKPLTPPAESTDGTKGANGNGGAEPAKEKVPIKIVEAEQEAQKKEVAAEAARKKAQTLTERLELLRDSISVEEELVDKSRRKAEQAEAENQTLTRELQRQLAENPANAADIMVKITEAQKRLSAARQELRDAHDRLDKLHAERHEAQNEQIEALQIAEQKRREAELASSKVDQLKNPLSLQNILQWIIDHCPKLLLIILGTLLLNELAKRLSRRIAKFVVFAGERGSFFDRQNRADTLSGVFRNAASLAVITGGTLMLLDAMGIPVVPLLGGAAIFGLAVAFGAQNLIRDYFSGFMVLMEDQYGVNDVIRVGEISGQVEEITLRMTRLRDLEGIVHFIPHGSLNIVSNLSHGWSRALFDVGVAYKENVDEVMKVLVQLSQELRNDPYFGPMVLEGPEMLGVNSFADSAVMIRFHLKTKPLMQWPVRRELNRRIKNRFDELGIEIPFPHQTLYFGEGQMPGLNRQSDA
jgi:small conductance mechanosensitive channel